MHIDMKHLHQVFFSVAITHLLSNDLLGARVANGWKA